MILEVVSRFGYEMDDDTYKRIEDGEISIEAAIVEGNARFLNSNIEYIKDGVTTEKYDITGEEMTKSLLLKEEA